MGGHSGRGEWRGNGGFLGGFRPKLGAGLYHILSSLPGLDVLHGHSTDFHFNKRKLAQIRVDALETVSPFPLGKISPYPKQTFSLLLSSPGNSGGLVARSVDSTPPLLLPRENCSTRRANNLNAMSNQSHFHFFPKKAFVQV